MGKRKRGCERQPLFARELAAAAAVVVAATAATAVVGQGSAEAVAAPAAQEQDEKDDPPAVIVAIHNEYLREIFSAAFAAHSMVFQRLHCVRGSGK